MSRDKVSIDALKEKAASGDVEAQKSLGMLYELGLEVGPDLNEAKKYWEQAASNGDAFAQLNMGELLSKGGDGLQADAKLAAVWFSKAEQGGLSSAHKRIGSIQSETSTSKVLIVDDSRAVRTTLKEILGDLNLGTLEAGNGKEAIRVLQSGQEIQMIITDCTLPVMDGLQMIKMIRQLKRFDHIPIVILTAESKKEIVIEAKKLKINGWLIKPPNADAIKAATERFVKRVTC